MKGSALEWLVGESDARALLTPERSSSEHRLVAQTAAEFVAREVAPALSALEQKQWSVARRLIGHAGELGLLGTDVPESAGGIGLDHAAAVAVAEVIGAESSFAMAFGAQTGLSILPILCFGTPAQRARYLPGLLAGTTVGAYCLSEAGSGSDALGARARAAQTADGSWRLDGEKLWITNGGFADVFIVFAQADGDRFSAFIVERAFGGVANGSEEHKMGLHGSSTTPVVLTQVAVPADNVLGEVGQGHRVAFNILNYGRFKLGATTTGAAKAAIGEACRYALTRQQFGQPISSFAAIRHKLAEMTIRTYAVESMLYRLAGSLDGTAGSAGHEPEGILAALEEFAVEASLLKVAASEMLDFVVDECVQVHGGNGLVADYPAERRYRDARPNRIFEGTNEINRLLVPGLIAKRVRQGRWPAALFDRDSPPPRAEPASTTAARSAAAMKAATRLVLGAAVRGFGDALASEQEVTMLVCDMLIDTFAAESAWLRAEAARQDRSERAALFADAAGVFVADASRRVETSGRVALAAIPLGPSIVSARAELDACGLGHEPVNTVAARRRIADGVLEQRGYAFNP